MKHFVECKYAMNGQCETGRGCFPVMHERVCPRMGNSILEYLNPATSIAIIWNIEDVKQAIKDFHIKCHELNEEELMEVLESVQDNHDANCGVNWQTLASEAEGLFVRDKK